jgi:glycosyltransferase involved in cell wall biosynthesis
LAPGRRGRRTHRQAVRRPALGHGRRARAPRAQARPPRPAAGAARDRAVDGPGRSRTRARRRRRARDPERHRPAPDTGDEEEPPHVLYAGRLSPEKGILDLVAAAEGLPLVVVGDGPLRDQVPQAIGFLPNPELQERLARAAVVAVPSHREGFGVVCLEAMAHGRAVVASAVGGLRDLVVDGETGFLVAPRDRDALRAALERLLADRELRTRLGAAGRERAAAHFSWERDSGLTLEAYEAALSLV